MRTERLSGLTDPKTKRPFQFSLRTLMAVVTLCAIVIGFYSWYDQIAVQSNRERLTELRINAPLLQHSLDRREPIPALGQVTKHRGLFSFEFVDSIDLHGTTINDTDLEGFDFLREMRELRKLNLSNTSITDACVKHLEVLRQLRSLDLRHSGVTDESVKKLQQGLPNCKILR